MASTIDNVRRQNDANVSNVMTGLEADSQMLTGSMTEIEARIRGLKDMIENW